MWKMEEANSNWTGEIFNNQVRFQAGKILSFSRIPKHLYFIELDQRACAKRLCIFVNLFQ